MQGEYEMHKSSWGSELIKLLKKKKGGCGGEEKKNTLSSVLYLEAVGAGREKGNGSDGSGTTAPKQRALWGTGCTPRTSWHGQAYINLALLWLKKEIKLLLASGRREAFNTGWIWPERGVGFGGPQPAIGPSA